MKTLYLLLIIPLFTTTEDKKLKLTYTNEKLGFTVTIPAFKDKKSGKKKTDWAFNTESENQDLEIVNSNLQELLITFALQEPSVTQPVWPAVTTLSRDVVEQSIKGYSKYFSSIKKLSETKGVFKSGANYIAARLETKSADNQAGYLDIYTFIGIRNNHLFTINIFRPAKLKKEIEKDISAIIENIITFSPTPKGKDHKITCECKPCQEKQKSSKKQNQKRS